MSPVSKHTLQLSFSDVASLCLLYAWTVSDVVFLHLWHAKVNLTSYVGLQLNNINMIY